MSRRPRKAGAGPARAVTVISFRIDEDVEESSELIGLHGGIKLARLDEAVAAFDRAEAILAAALARLLDGEDPFAGTPDVEIARAAAPAEFRTTADGRGVVAFDRRFARCLAKGLREDVADALRAWMGAVDEIRRNRRILAEILRDRLGETDWKMPAHDAVAKHGIGAFGPPDELVDQAVADLMEDAGSAPDPRILH